MSQEAVPWLLILGGIFIILGIAAMLWGRAEQRNYDSSLSSHRDVREYLEHWPPRIEAKALIIGGWITIVVGVVLAGMAGIFLMRG